MIRKKTTIEHFNIQSSLNALVPVLCTGIIMGITSCGSDKHSDNQQASKVDTRIYSNVTKQIPEADAAQTDNQILSTWLQKACNINYEFTGNRIEKSLFTSFQDYNNDPSTELIDVLKDSLLVDFIGKGAQYRTVDVSPYVITFRYDEEDEPGTGRVLYLMEHKVYFTKWYASAAETFEYDLKTLKVKKLPYSINSIQDKTAFVEKSYYDPRGPEDPDYEGHILKEGKMDILTGKIEWLEEQ